MNVSIRSVGKNAVIAGTGILINGPLTFINSTLLARGLGIDGYGDFLLIFSIMGISSVITTIGMQVGVSKFIAQYIALGQGQKAYSVFKNLCFFVFLNSILVGSICFVFSDPIAGFLDRPALSSYIRLSCLGLPATVLIDMSLYSLRGLNKISLQILFEKVLQPVLLLLLYILILSILKLSILYIFLGFVVEQYLIGAVLFSQTIKNFQGIRAESANLANIKDWLWFSFPVFLDKFLQFLVTQAGLEIFLLAKYSTPSEVGTYGYFYRIMPIIMMPAISFSIAFGPTVAALYTQKKISQLRDNFSTINRWIVILTFPMLFFVLNFATYIFGLTGTTLDQRGYTALALLVFGGLIDAAVGEVRGIMLMTGMSKSYLVNSSSLLIVNFVLGFLLIPEFGIVGAAIAGAVSRIILNLVGLTQVYLLLKIHPLNWDYFKPWVAALSGLIVTLLIAGFVQGNFIADLSRYGLWFIIYISFLLLLGPKQNEKDMVKYILEKGSRRLKHNG